MRWWCAAISFQCWAANSISQMTSQKSGQKKHEKFKESWSCAGGGGGEAMAASTITTITKMKDGDSSMNMVWVWNIICKYIFDFLCTI